MNKFYITTPIFYPNNKLHLGHAYVAVLADIFFRYHKSIGDNSYFVTGADEHSSKVVKSAQKKGNSINEYTDKISTNFKDLFFNLEVDYSYFVRTSDKNSHWDGAIELWNRLVDAGDIYKSAYKGKYCNGCESFIKETDLLDGKCPFHNEIPQTINETNYFFKLSKYQDQILQLFSEDVIKILPHSRKDETISFIKSGILDVSFSRPLSTNSWSIPIPSDPEHGMYVWCDALSSYITAVGFPNETKKFNTYWPADCHLIGKDILRFHTVIWIGMLLSAKISLPKNIIVHGMLLSNGKKMSKTLGNIIDPEVLIDKYGAEALRYFFARHIPLFDDGEISLNVFHEACRSNLLNGLGNLTSRVFSMALMYGVEITKGRKFLDIISKTEYAWYCKEFDLFQINNVMDKIWEMIHNLDKTISEEEPFKIFKKNPDKAKKMVAKYLEKIWVLAQLLKPILPKTSDQIKLSFEKKRKSLLFDKTIFEQI